MTTTGRRLSGLMTRAVLGTAVLLPGPAMAGAAAGPEGNWRVEDGKAIIRVAKCEGAYWGSLAWTRRPATDSHNPDPAERDQPLVGVRILRGMQPSGPGTWSGQIYNAENGKLYDSRIALTAPNALKVSGCVLGGIICGGQTWTRLAPEEAKAAALPSDKDLAVCPETAPDTGPPR